MLAGDGAFDALEISFELVPPCGCRLGFIDTPGLRFFLRPGMPAALEFGPCLAGGGPAVAGAGGPRLVPGAAGFEPLPFGGQLCGESLGARYAGFVSLDLGVCGLLQSVGFGLRGEAQ